MSRLPSSPLPPAVQPTLLRDTRGRALRDLRISVTDRCNFRCTYCMPKEVFGKMTFICPAVLCWTLKRSPDWPGFLLPMAWAKFA